MTNDQARHIYKKVKLGSIVNIDTIKQVTEEDKLSKDNVNNDETNPYHKIIVNNIAKENIITSQMEQWSILSNVGNYIQHDRNPKKCYD